MLYTCNLYNVINLCYLNLKEKNNRKRKREGWALSFNLFPLFLKNMWEGIGHLLLKGNPFVKQGASAAQQMPCHVL